MAHDFRKPTSCSPILPLAPRKAAVGRRDLISQ
jgi:hypothetical protein